MNEVEAPLGAGKDCKATVDLRFMQLGTSPVPYSKAEDPPPLQLRALGTPIPAVKAR